MKIHPPYTAKQLKTAGLTKQELIERMITLDLFRKYDTALPQYWLDWFVDISGLEYHLVLSTTVWCYDNPNCPYPISGCTEVQRMIDKYVPKL